MLRSDQRFESFKFRLNIGTLIEGQNSLQFSCFAGWAIGELRVRVHARTGWVRPRANTVFPASDNPPRFRFVVTSDKRVCDQFIVVGQLIETSGLGQHHAVLNDQSGELLR